MEGNGFVLEKGENERLAVFILAAGRSKRMRTLLPKVFHAVCGRPILSYVMDCAGALGPGEIAVVLGPDAPEGVVDFAGTRRVVQEEPLGTGHAVLLALEHLPDVFEEVLVLPGDSPLMRPSTLIELIRLRRKDLAEAAMLCSRLEDPSGYGRVLTDEDGSVRAVVEDSDADERVREVREINAGIYAFERGRLAEALGKLDADNAQGEYYLTGVIKEISASGGRVVALEAPEEEAIGVNTREQLALAAERMRMRINRELMSSGVTMIDPSCTYIDSDVRIGQDTIIKPFVFIGGNSVVGNGCEIGPFTSIRDSRIGDGTRVEFSWVEKSEVGEGCNIGPFSRLRQGCRLSSSVRVGSFVEIKNTAVGRGSKVPHLSYMGDAVIGEDVNVGAGSITCNYDGEKKHPTTIGDRAFLGSDTMLIAPLRIGNDAATGAGSAIYEDVPDGSLGIERSEQKNVPGWREKRKKKKGRSL